MSINKEQLRNLIERTLKEVDLYSEDAVNLLMGTAAKESHLGTYIRQINGPALGIFQMEPNTFNDIRDNYLVHKPDLMHKVIVISGGTALRPTEAEWNLKTAIIFCRLHYLRKPDALPSTIEGMAAYWKQHYNTYLGAGTEEQFIANYKKYVL